MNSIFDDVLREEERLRDKKLELNNQKALFRNNEIALANKEFELAMLEADKAGLDITNEKLGDRVAHNRANLGVTADNARGTANTNAGLEEQIRKYENLIRVLEDEEAERVRQGKRTLRNVNPRGADDGTGDVSMELLMAQREREKANKELENIGDKWKNKLSNVANEAQKMVSPNEVEQEQRTEIERLLQEIHASNQRSTALDSKLDGIRSAIKQEETLGISKLTEQAIEEQAQRNAQFHENEDMIAGEIEDAKRGLQRKEVLLQNEGVIVDQLHDKLKALEDEK